MSTSWPTRCFTEARGRGGRRSERPRKELRKREMKRKRERDSYGRQPAGLAPEDIDFFPSPARTPPKAGDTDSGRYPAEYRKLISDYFKSVAEKG